MISIYYFIFCELVRSNGKTINTAKLLIINLIPFGKNNGLIVDYIETYKSLLEALAIYGTGGHTGGGGATGGGEEPPVRPLEELIEELEEAIALTESYLKDELKFDLATIVNLDDQLQRLAAIQTGVNAVYITDDTKSRFGVLAREVYARCEANRSGASGKIRTE